MKKYNILTILLSATNALVIYVSFCAIPTLLASEEPGNVHKYNIIDCHEHIQSIKQADKTIAAMDRIGIEKAILVGSPWFTMTMNEKSGFTRYDWNNSQLLKIVEKYRGRFEAWPTINPLDSDKLEK
jgi:hypothetical protein